MKKRILFISLCMIFAAEAAAFFIVFFQGREKPQDVIAVNETLQSVQTGGENTSALEYVVLDLNGTVLYRTKPGLSESIYEAVRHRDTILDVVVEGRTSGKLIIYNDSKEVFQEGRDRAMVLLAVTMSVCCMVCAGYFFYLERVVIKPFQKLKGFAKRVAAGNLDIPLEMDRNNLFGAFTESFDLMRSELKRARLAQAKANEEKKELIAKLSHDIRTPVASIKAAAEVGAALAEQEIKKKSGDFHDDGTYSGKEETLGTAACSGSERFRENYVQIIRKSDQIDTLVKNLFTAALEELRRLSVTPADMESQEVQALLENADYLHRAKITDVPGCLVWADRLRLQQVFDNLFSNSYKYSGTEIAVKAKLETGFLIIVIEDFGGGVGEEELPFLKEKFKRGKNAQDASGAGLGLYISDYFMKEMDGELIVENGDRGLKASTRIRLSGGKKPI